MKRIRIRDQFDHGVRIVGEPLSRATRSSGVSIVDTELVAGCPSKSSSKQFSLCELVICKLWLTLTEECREPVCPRSLIGDTASQHLLQHFQDRAELISIQLFEF